MANIFDNKDLVKMSSEELVLAINELENEKKRRAKIDKRNSAIEFREALDKFMNSGAYGDFSIECALSPHDCDIIWDCDTEYSDYDIESIGFNAFDYDILLTMKNELTRRIGNYEG